LGEISVSIDVAQVTLSGIVEDCDGNPMGGLMVLANTAENGTSDYASTSADGSFNISLLCLTNGVVTVDVFDFESALQVTDIEVEYDVTTTETYDMGAVSFCEAEDLEMYFTYNEGDYEFIYPHVQLMDSSMCLQLYGSTQGLTTSGIFMDLGVPTGTGTAPVCNVEGASLYHYYEGTQESYIAQMYNYSFVITDLEIVDDEFTLMEGTYTTDVAVTGYIDGEGINYTTVASGSFRFIQE
jgi:hypothetical protein